MSSFGMVFVKYGYGNVLSYAVKVWIHNYIVLHETPFFVPIISSCIFCFHWVQYCVTVHIFVSTISYMWHVNMYFFLNKCLLHALWLCTFIVHDHAYNNPIWVKRFWPLNLGKSITWTIFAMSRPLRKTLQEHSCIVSI